MTVKVYSTRQPPAAELRVGAAEQVLADVTNVDAVFADPPFNIGVDYGRDGHGRKINDSLSQIEYEAWTVDWMSTIDAMCRPGASIFVHVPDDAVLGVELAARECRWVRETWIIWHYQFGQCTFDHFIHSHEHLLMYVKPPHAERTWDVDRSLTVSARARTGDKRVQASARGGLRPHLDVWQGAFMGRVQGNNAERRPGHPNQLPECYVARALRAVTRRGDLVVDPFVGSGTTAVVARALGCRFIGAEKSPESAMSAWDRVGRVGCVRNVNAKTL